MDSSLHYVQETFAPLRWLTDYRDTSRQCPILQQTNPLFPVHSCQNGNAACKPIRQVDNGVHRIPSHSSGSQTSQYQSVCRHFLCLWYCWLCISSRGTVCVTLDKSSRNVPNKQVRSLRFQFQCTLEGKASDVRSLHVKPPICWFPDRLRILWHPVHPEYKHPDQRPVEWNSRENFALPNLYRSSL